MTQVDDRGARGAPPFVVVGIVNATPDSFSDGGAYDPVDHGRRLIDEGADWIDVGGESTRPGAAAVAADDEWARIAPVLRALRNHTVVCVDTSKALVAARAADEGATVLNDVTGLRDPAMAAVTARFAHTVVMHMRGTPATMRAMTSYDDVVVEVRDALVAAAARSRSPTTWIDPGLGFAKTADQSLTLLAATPTFVATGLPVYLGASRKSFLTAVVGPEPVDRRLSASLGAVAAGYARGARAFRVHDVRETRQLLDTLAAVDAAESP